MADGLNTFLAAICLAVVTAGTFLVIIVGRPHDDR